MEDKASKQRRQPLQNHGVEWNGNLTAVAGIATEIQFCELAGWLISGWGIERQGDLQKMDLPVHGRFLLPDFEAVPSVYCW